MATHFARSIISPRITQSPKLSPDCLKQLNQTPEHRRVRFHASRMLLAEMMYMLYGYPSLPAITTSPTGRPEFTDPSLPGFSISYVGNMVGIALCTDGECGLSMALPHNPLALSRLAAEKVPQFTRNEITWINNQNNAFEARAQLVTLRTSIAKLSGQRNFDDSHIQLLPGAGRLRATQAPNIEALCDIEDVLVWAIAASPQIEHLRLWEFSNENGWRGMAEITPENHGPRDRIMRFTSMPCENVMSFH